MEEVGLAGTLSVTGVSKMSIALWPSHRPPQVTAMVRLSRPKAELPKLGTNPSRDVAMRKVVGLQNPAAPRLLGAPGVRPRLVGSRL